MDVKKLKDFAASQPKKNPFPPKMKGYGKKGMHAPIVPKEAAEDDGEGDKDVDVDAIAAQVENGQGDKKLMKLTKKYDPEKMGNPPSWIDPEDEDIWEKAKKAVGSEEDSDYDNYWAVVGHVYQSMGGSIKGGGKGALQQWAKEEESEKEHGGDDPDEDDDEDVNEDDED